MQRFFALILVLCFAALGSGLARHAHELQHAMEDACGAAEHSQAPADRPHHDASNCLLHAQLSSPLSAATAVPVLISLGLIVAFLTLLPADLPTLRLPVRIDCRGPPLAC